MCVGSRLENRIRPGGCKNNIGMGARDPTGRWVIFFVVSRTIDYIIAKVAEKRETTDDHDFV